MSCSFNNPAARCFQQGFDSRSVDGPIDGIGEYLFGGLAVGYVHSLDDGTGKLKCNRSAGQLPHPGGYDA